MRKAIISLVAAMVSLVPACVLADGMPSSATEASPGHVTQADLQPTAPDTYTVVKGDTLWGISGKFLKDPWKWPQIWQMNRDQIKNPHWIYPGDILALNRNAPGGPQLSLATGAAVGGGSDVAVANVVHLEPRVRTESLTTAIPTIPGSAIGPFLSQPLVVEPGGLDASPTIVAPEEGRVMASAGESAYADRIGTADGVNWQVFRPGPVLHDPDTDEVLGVEAKYLGDARVRRFGNPTTLTITRSVEEINQGDRLTPARESTFPNYVPHAPDKPIVGKIMGVQGGVAEIGQYEIIQINRGSRDGLEVGHVLASYHTGAIVGGLEHDMGATSGERSDSWLGKLKIGSLSMKPNPVVPDPPATAAAKDDKPGAVLAAGPVKLPDERNGIIFVFRVFEKMSYAIVMRANKPIYVGDVVRTP